MSSGASLSSRAKSKRPNRSSGSWTTTMFLPMRALSRSTNRMCSRFSAPAVRRALRSANGTRRVGRVVRCVCARCAREDDGGGVYTQQRGTGLAPPVKHARPWDHTARPSEPRRSGRAGGRRSCREQKKDVRGPVGRAADALLRLQPRVALAPHDAPRAPEPQREVVRLLHRGLVVVPARPRPAAAKAWLSLARQH